MLAPKRAQAPLKGRNSMPCDCSTTGSVLEYRKMVQLAQSRVRSCLLQGDASGWSESRGRSDPGVAKWKAAISSTARQQGQQATGTGYVYEQ